eukprot:7972234-Lingulodinium_polyedra.AAC.1
MLLGRARAQHGPPQPRGGRGTGVAGARGPETVTRPGGRPAPQTQRGGNTPRKASRAKVKEKRSGRPRAGPHAGPRPRNVRRLLPLAA